ncbi:MAG TPA: PQQ-binding-like beta-propeller repeat protein [Vicinamibacterales bacterium]|nr:PQQ-binding-like beta-propeller repeat protein [Vicinamibacterales bacterium]
MNTIAPAPPARPLRLRPGVALALVLLLLKLVVPLFAPQATPLGVLGGPVLALLIAIWWLFFSRAPGIERVGALLLIAAALIMASRFVHVSIMTGMMGFMYPFYAVPVMALALVGWAVAARTLPDRPRRLALVVIVSLVAVGWTLVRTDGFSGYIDHDWALRWTKTPEERLIAQANDEPPAPPAQPAATSEAAAPAAPAVTAPVAAVPSAAMPSAAVPSAAMPSAAMPSAAKVETAAEWPGFRGPARDGTVRGVTIDTDWTKSPPVELWRRPIGPGWGSFAVHGDLLYTQEQRGDDEIVSAYAMSTGKPVWRHHDPARFWESNGGPGPRATPTFSGGRVYTLGATGILNALDAQSGAVIWSHNAAKDTGASMPLWGFSGSPLVVDDMVIVATAGVLAAYDASSGQRRWNGPAGDDSYTSPQLMTIDGVRQVVHMSGAGLTSVAPADGKVLWQHAWKGYPIVQPSQMPDGGILIAANESSGTRRLAATHAAGAWTVAERWTSNGLKPYFNDFVVHKGHAFGFDGSILSCIDLTDGTRKWKGGRYGGGQLVLLPDSEVLLVLSEEGELALVSATPDGFKELARAPAISGKTWNHPVIAGRTLLVRNGEEMAAFRLPGR